MATERTKANKADIFLCTAIRSRIQIHQIPTWLSANSSPVSLPSRQTQRGLRSTQPPISHATGTWGLPGWAQTRRLHRPRPPPAPGCRSAGAPPSRPPPPRWQRCPASLQQGVSGRAWWHDEQLRADPAVGLKSKVRHLLQPALTTSPHGADSAVHHHMAGTASSPPGCRPCSPGTASSPAACASRPARVKAEALATSTHRPSSAFGEGAEGPEGSEWAAQGPEGSEWSAHASHSTTRLHSGRPMQHRGRHNLSESCKHSTAAANPAAPASQRTSGLRCAICSCISAAGSSRAVMPRLQQNKGGTGTAGVRLCSAVADAGQC